MSDAVLIPMRFGPWDGERRRFVAPIPRTLFVKSGGEYRLENDYRGIAFVWYADQTNPPVGKGVVE